MAQKQAEGIAEKRSGRRGPGSVWGSGAAGAIAAVAALLLGDPSGRSHVLVHVYGDLLSPFMVSV